MKIGLMNNQIRLHCLFVASLVVTAIAASHHAQAQNTGGNINAVGGFGFNTGAVGGVKVDASGTVQTATTADREAILRGLQEKITGAQGDLAKAAPVRMVSLRRLQQAIVDAQSAGKPLSEEMIFLAGLQRIEYLFVYPEEHDIVIAGPAEPWIVRQDASVVGKQSLRPVLQLEDLLTAFRTVDAARQHPISVSIEPTSEGTQRLEQLLANVVTRPGFLPQSIEPAMREAFGSQQVKFTTISTQSRMAHTLVAADYFMKRLSLKLDDSPVAGLPSYLDLVKNSGNSKTQPRWWIACDYDAVLKSDDALAWKLVGRGVKAMTEEEFVAADGTRTGTGKANKTAQRWADMFTDKYDALCVHNVAFGDLRNTMDMNVIATIIAAYQLEQIAGCDLAVIRGVSGSLKTNTWQTPKTIPPHCSFIKGSRGWVVSVSGGVDVNPWQVVSQDVKVDNSLAKIRSSTDAAKRSIWWWN